MSKEVETNFQQEGSSPQISRKRLCAQKRYHLSNRTQGASGRLTMKIENPKGRSMQKLRIKRQSNCIRSSTIHLGRPAIKRPPIRSICRSKTRNRGIQSC
ncbi:hypothetical protein MTR_3g046837 [Medicago truncatula]|uniref:Uncharacterized protein n=1 Tax=Medicago truncatula TaxID=3880 RepID=A0A072V5V4_MEDTR|nr:hypothetical protein MTR_3g046837 [Medicago truncatula]